MFMISNPDMTVACCRAGMIGTFPALNCRDNSGYVAWLEEIDRRLARHAEETGKFPAPFGVNLSMRHTDDG